MEKKVVGIVGAGSSGLLACKYALSKGYYPIVFESQSSIGGLWTKTMENTKLQTPKQFYQFSDFPWPSSVQTDFPDQSQLIDYLQAYAKHFDLIKYIKFNTNVVSIKYEGPSLDDIQSWTLWGGNVDPFGMGKWIITTQHCLTQPNDEVHKVVQVDFVILCVGRFGGIPNIPDQYPLGKGPEVFEGKLMHYMDFAAMNYETTHTLVKGKNVTIVGFKKSALDIAMACSSINGVKHPCTMICRTARWQVPESFPWGSLMLNRFFELLVHKPGEGPLLNLLTSLLSPLRWAIFKYVENEIKKKQPLEKYGMVPNHSFLEEINNCSASAIPTGFYNNVEEGSIILKRSSTFNFYKEGVFVYDDVGNAQSIKTDLVLFATGFKGDQKLIDIFACPKFQKYMMGLGSYNNNVPLYRECIHPRIPQLGVIGFLQSISSLYTTELRCRWLFELLDGKFKLPNIEKMENEVFEWENFMKNNHGDGLYSKHCLGALHIWYNDQLCKDMGQNPKRKTTLWAELFEAYGPMDYNFS